MTISEIIEFLDKKITTAEDGSGSAWIATKDLVEIKEFVIEQEDKMRDDQEEGYLLPPGIGITGIDTSAGKFELLPEGTILWVKDGIGTRQATLTPKEWEGLAAIIPVMLAILVGEPEEGKQE